jgi:hypothetical protein
MTKFLRVIFLFVMVLLLAVPSVHAQLTGSNIPGDFGLKSGSQAPPGVWVGYLLYNYTSSKIVDSNGRELSLTNGEIDARAHVPVFSVVTKKKLFGANYGAALYPSVMNLAIEAPRVSLNKGTGYGAGDLYVQPINLGWTTKHADVITWYGLFAPTGKYAPGGEGNRGYGMWSHELGLGSTVYFNEKKTLHASALGAYEIHSKKRDTDSKVGQLLTIEGGVGATAKQALNFGMAYYAQWKVTKDSGLGLPTLVEGRLGKNHNYGLGPEVSMVLPLSKDFSKLAVLDFRYLFDVGTQLDMKGQTLVFTLTFKVH